MHKIIPAALKAGDEIRIVAPSRGIKIIGQDSRDNAARRFEEMGLKVTYAEHATDDNWDMLGTTSVANRAEDITEAFADVNVKGIFTMIGGFNSNQLLPFLDYEVIKKHPKVFCGFSDITALLNGIYAKTGLVTFSGPHFSSFGMEKGFDYTWDYMKKMLLGKGSYVIEPSKEWSDDLWFIEQEKRQFIKNEGYWKIHAGKLAERLSAVISEPLICCSALNIARSLKTIRFCLLRIVLSQPETALHFYASCRLWLINLTFKKVKAVVIGRFQKASEVDEAKLRYIVETIPQLKNIPVVGNVDFGHTTPMLTLPIGGFCEISATGINIKI